MSRHTPGPWLWQKVATPELVTEHTLEGPDVLCRYWYDKPPSADARLIAAAPDLLAALVGLLELGRKDTSNPKYDGYYETARAAIAKAEAQSE